MFPGYDKNFSRKLKINNLMEIVDDVDDYDVIDINDTINISLFQNLSDIEKKIINDYVETLVNNKMMVYFEKKEKRDIYYREFDNDFYQGKDNPRNLENNLNKIIIKKDKSIVVNGNICSEIISMTSKFRPYVGNNNTNQTYLIGKYNDVDVYINPYLRWDNNIMLIFNDEKFYSYSDYKIVPYSHPTFNITSEISFKLYIKKDIRYDLYNFIELDEQATTLKVNYF